MSHHKNRHPFSEYGIGSDLCRVLEEEGIFNPTPIQTLAIEPIVNGRDLIGEAQTGTGKTLAFLLPIFEAINIEADHLQAIIVAPTRELAIQITEEARKLQRAKDVRILAAYGGQDIISQVHKLQKKIHLVVGTAGRLIDHLKRGTLDPSNLSFLVLDEADQMLHMGFLPDVETLIKRTPETRQTLCFSATMGDPIRRLASKYMKDPVRVAVEAPTITLDAIDQRVVETTDRNKQESLIQILKEEQPFMAIIFCRTKIRAGRLAIAMTQAGFNCAELHGNLTQARREAVMKDFRNLKTQYLIATDVAARGLDIDGITHVFNFDMPMDTESYIHRIGRTGRAGQKGRAYTLVAPKDKNMLKAIEEGTEQNLRIRKVNLDAKPAIARKRPFDKKRSVDKKQSNDKKPSDDKKYPSDKKYSSDKKHPSDKKHFGEKKNSIENKHEGGKHTHPKGRKPLDGKRSFEEKKPFEATKKPNNGKSRSFGKPSGSSKPSSFGKPGKTKHQSRKKSH